MAVRDIFSKRKAAESGQVLMPQTEVLPAKFRTQVVHILRDVIGEWNNHDYRNTTFANMFWSKIRGIVSREHGLFSLSSRINPYEDCVDCLAKGEPDITLDLIEQSLYTIEYITLDNKKWAERGDIMNPVSAGEAIEEFSVCCREDGVGFRFTGGQIVETASEFTHSELVAPAVRLLHDQGFDGAHDEFMIAHKHMRNGDYKPAINNCLKSFESVMKTICDRKGWTYKPTDTAKHLLDILFREGLIPAYLQSHFAGLRSMLEGGVPTVRNKTSGHGQSADPIVVPRPLAEYVVHTTAANISLLVSSA